MAAGVIRAYRAGDAAAVRRLIAVLQRHEHALSPATECGAEVAPRYFRAMMGEVRRARGAVFVADEGRVVGFVSMWVEDTRADVDSRPVRYVYVSDIVVEPRARRRGVGRALLAEADAFARRRRVGQVRLNVLAANGTARAAYRACGYREYTLSLIRRVRGTS